MLEQTSASISTSTRSGIIISSLDKVVIHLLEDYQLDPRSLLRSMCPWVRLEPLIGSWWTSCTTFDSLNRQFSFLNSASFREDAAQRPEQDKDDRRSHLTRSKTFLTFLQMVMEKECWRGQPRSYVREPPITEHLWKWHNAERNKKKNRGQRERKNKE